ncbi:hypothetical protein [Saccharothrix deserti]|uniref:hypothetical protein n=1 Tax=Saccharothrix deserti TaxID=2593674 RepID=UPI00131DB868|nr:hypothetical protein [Saccharothrix deserti]
MSDHRADIEAKVPDVTAIPLGDLAAIPAEQLADALRLVVSRTLTGSEVQSQVE